MSSKDSEHRTSISRLPPPISSLFHGVIHSWLFRPGRLAESSRGRSGAQNAGWAFMRAERAKQKSGEDDYIFENYWLEASEADR